MITLKVWPKIRKYTSNLSKIKS